MKAPACWSVAPAFLCALGAVAAFGAEPDSRIRRTPVVTAVERVRNSVVNISTERVVIVRGVPSFGPGADLFEQFFRQNFPGPEIGRRKVETPLGSGSVITTDGLVITNEHVVRQATNIKLSLDTGESFEADLLAADYGQDMALLRAKSPKPLQAIPMGSSSDLMLGETVVALGNPLGFENSVTSGIISALNREIDVGEGDAAAHYTGLIQTSALINPGNSGGPLVNVLGEIIGINIAVANQAQGIGFATPIDHVRDVLGPMLAAPPVSDAWLGVRGETEKDRRGVRVSQVDPGSPAAKLLTPGDVIRKMDQRPIGDLFDLSLRLLACIPGQEVTLSLLRGGNEAEVRVQLAKIPEPSPKEILRDKLGISGQTMTAALARNLRVAVGEGVLITEVLRDGPAAGAGLEADDVVTQIGPHPVRGEREAAAVLGGTPGGARLVVVIVRGNYRAYTRITVPR